METTTRDLPLVGLTMGDVAGIGPEVIARAWLDPAFHALARPIAIGDPEILGRAVRLVGAADNIGIRIIGDPEEARPDPGSIPCLPVADAPSDLAAVRPGTVDRRAGRAAFAFLNAAIDLALDRRIDAIATLPLNKLALHEAGVNHPGHTEILAERCGTPDHAMMLYLETDSPASDGRPSTKPAGLGVIHVTLHVSLRRVFDLLSREAIATKIRLADRAMRPLLDGARPRIAVTALNPHAGEDGLFGDEEQTLIRPAVEEAMAEGIDVAGPFPNDTIFYNALNGSFDAVVAMYHDQGHIALKTVGFQRAVNVTLGLPIIRTSVAHGTAYDIAWQDRADAASLIAAVRVAGRIARFHASGRVPSGG